MKILLLATSFFELGGIGTFLRQLAHALVTLDHRVNVLSLRDGDLPREDRVYPHPGPFGHLRYRCAGTKQRFARLAWEISRSCDFVVAGHPKTACLAWALRKPYIATAYGVDVFKRPSWFTLWGLDYGLRIVCLSAYTAAHLEMDHSMVIYPAVPDHMLETGKTAVGTPRHSMFTILSVSRLHPAERYKGHEQVIAALPEIQRRIGPVCYNIVGGGDDEPRLGNLAGLYAPGAVSFYGHVGADTLMNLYASCDLYVLPSTREGLGVTFLEAQAFGKPVIAGGGGCLEAMQDGVTGYSTHNDPDYPLAERIIELAQDDQKRIQMGRAGRRFVEDGFTQARFTQDVETLLATLSGSS